MATANGKRTEASRGTTAMWLCPCWGGSKKPLKDSLPLGNNAKDRNGEQVVFSHSLSKNHVFPFEKALLHAVAHVIAALWSSRILFSNCKS